MLRLAALPVDFLNTLFLDEPNGFGTLDGFDLTTRLACVLRGFGLGLIFGAGFDLRGALLTVIFDAAFCFFCGALLTRVFDVPAVVGDFLFGATLDVLALGTGAGFDTFAF